MKINYHFNNGENSEVEVSEELGAVILESRRKEENLARKERYHCVSMENSEFEGVDFIDETTPEMLFFEQIENEHILETLDKLSETQRRRLILWVDGMSFLDIAKYEGVSHVAVMKSIEAAKKFLKMGYKNGVQIS